MSEAIPIETELEQTRHYNPNDGFFGYPIPFEQRIRFVDINQVEHAGHRLLRAYEFIRGKSDERAFYRFLEDYHLTESCPYDEDQETYLYPVEIVLVYREELTWRDEFRSLPAIIDRKTVADTLGAPESWLSEVLRDTESQHKTRLTYNKSILKFLRQQKFLLPNITNNQTSLLEVAAFLELDENDLLEVVSSFNISVEHHIDHGVLVPTIPREALGALKSSLPLGGDWLNTRLIGDQADIPQGWVNIQMQQYGITSEQRFNDEGVLEPHYPPDSLHAVTFEDLVDYQDQFAHLHLDITETFAIGSLFSRIKLERARLELMKPHAAIADPAEVEGAYIKIAKDRMQIIDALSYYANPATSN